MYPKREFIQAVEKAGFTRSTMFLDVCRYKRHPFALEFYTLPQRWKITVIQTTNYQTITKNIYAHSKETVPKMIQRALDFAGEHNAT